MWVYEKKLEYPVKIKNPNPKLAKIIITQYGGTDCERILFSNNNVTTEVTFIKCQTIFRQNENPHEH